MELTEQQEQEMIDLAKQGDPEANYKLSLWALEQAMAEPDEERWNRLAAKCLVKAAEAGYAPAQAKMNELLSQAPAAPETAPYPAADDAGFFDDPAPVTAARSEYDYDEDDEDGAPRKNGGALFGKVKGLFARPAAFDGDEDGSASDVDDADEDEDVKVAGAGRPARSGRAAASGKGGFLDFSSWEPSRWKTIQVVGLIVCAVLVILIASMVIRNHRDRGTEPEQTQLTIPVPESIAPEPTDTPEPTAEVEDNTYPTQAIRAEIAAASTLDVFPADSDFVDSPTTVTVATESSALNVRSGPGTTNRQVGTVDKGAVLNVYAYKNGWALMEHDGLWGWCSNDYLSR